MISYIRHDFHWWFDRWLRCMQWIRISSNLLLIYLLTYFRNNVAYGLFRLSFLFFGSCWLDVRIQISLFEIRQQIRWVSILLSLFRIIKRWLHVLHVTFWINGILINTLWDIDIDINCFLNGFMYRIFLRYHYYYFTWTINDQWHVLIVANFRYHYFTWTINDRWHFLVVANNITIGSWCSLFDLRCVLFQRALWWLIVYNVKVIMKILRWFFCNWP